jgi:poly(hydroxyalkanoate) granule-associated protein
MTIFNVVRNALMAGFGVQEKVKEFIDELVKKGELSESQGAKLVKEWTEKADKTSSDVSKSADDLVSNLSKSADDIVSKTLQKMNIPTKEDIERLNKKIQSLSARVKKLEGTPEQGEPE